MSEQQARETKEMVHQMKHPYIQTPPIEKHRNHLSPSSFIENAMESTRKPPASPPLLSPLLQIRIQFQFQNLPQSHPLKKSKIRKTKTHHISNTSPPSLIQPDPFIRRLMAEQITQIPRHRHLSRLRWLAPTFPIPVPVPNPILSVSTSVSGASWHWR